MPSMIVSVRRRLPKRLRTGGLRLLGRAPAVEPERIREFKLALPVTPPRTLSIRTPAWSSVGRRLEETGLAGYEPDTLACFLAAIQESGSRPVFDVGANIGVFSWLASALTPATVVAFEPTPDLTVQMRSICAANALGVVVEESALGAAPGTAELHLSDSTDSSNSLRAGFRASHGSVSVPVETVDGYVGRTGIRPAVLKIDTESTEPDVLRGAAELLAHQRPWIVCEVLAGRTESELTATLGPLGYVWYRIDGSDPLERRSIIEGDPTYEHMNWLFAPRSPGDSFWQSLREWRRSIAATSG